MFQFEEDSDEDTEKQLRDTQRLTEVLEAEELSLGGASKLSYSTGISLTANELENQTNIETSIALNRLIVSKLVQFEKMLIHRLHECRKKIADIQNFDQVNDKVNKEEPFRYINCGKPYFKDKDGFPAPENEDTILMRKSGMYDFSCIATVPGWTIKDKSDFIASMHKISKEIRIQQINSKIAQLNREMKTPSNKKENEKEIANLKTQLNLVHKKSLKDLALPIHEEYDWDTIANKLTQRHYAQEYRSLWKLFLHPSINKNCWTRKEHLLLQTVAHAHKLRNWEKIAQELGSNRTGYQCFVYFRTNMSNTFTNHKWTQEEEEYLKRIIEYYKEEEYIPWGRVAASMENRTKIQIYNKYMRLIDYRKGRFLNEEDGVILNAAEKFGTNFKKFKGLVPGRSESQLRNRYKVLTKTRLSTVWTETEDKKLIDLMANQDCSTNYSSLCRHLPGKDRTNIRARYITLMRWMQRNPNVDISYAPRRGARRLCHGQASENLNKAVEKLKTRMQDEEQTKKSHRLSRNSPEEDIDEAIIAHLITEYIKDTEEREPLPGQRHYKLFDGIVVSADALNATNLKKVLILLKAKLNQDSFKQSCYCSKFPELLNPEKEVSLVKVKSYSKKNLVNTIKIEKPPDIWGDSLTNPSEYVLPPHLATMTACKVFIRHLSKKGLEKTNISAMQRKNPLFKEQMNRLMERFNILFLWPVLLSNEVPEDITNKQKSYRVVRPAFNQNLEAAKQRITLIDSDDDDAD